MLITYYCSGAITDISTCANILTLLKTYQPQDTSLVFDHIIPIKCKHPQCIDCVATQCELLWEELFKGK